MECTFYRHFIHSTFMFKQEILSPNQVPVFQVTSCNQEYDHIFNIDACISGTKIHIVKHYIPKVALLSLLLRESSKICFHSTVNKQELLFPFECASLLKHVLIFLLRPLTTLCPE